DQDCDGADDNGCGCCVGSACHEPRACPSGPDCAGGKKGTQTCGSDGKWAACEGAVPCPPPDTGVPPPDAAVQATPPRADSPPGPPPVDAPVVDPEPDAGPDQAADAPPDAAPDAPPQQACWCVPGSQRWCDAPIGCLWGKQTCTPDGNWGTCEEAA